MTKLTRMTFAYLLEGADTPAEATINNVSLVAWDKTRAIRKWPTSTDAPSLWQTFVLWHHLNRTGVYAGKFDQFETDCLDLELQDEADDEVNPTQREATHD